MSACLSTWFREQGQNHPRGRRAGGQNSNRQQLSPHERHYLRLVREDREGLRRRMQPLDVYTAFLLLEDRWAEAKR